LQKSWYALHLLVYLLLILQVTKGQLAANFLLLCQSYRRTVLLYGRPTPAIIR